MEYKDTLQNSWLYKSRKIICKRDDEQSTTEVFYTIKNNVIDYYWYIHNNKENTYAIQKVCTVFDKYNYNWWENLYNLCASEITDDFIEGIACKEAEKYFDDVCSEGITEFVGDFAVKEAHKSFVDSLITSGEWSRDLYKQNKEQWKLIGTEKTHTIGWGYDSLYYRWYELVALECDDGLIFNAVYIDKGNRIGYENIGGVENICWKCFLDAYCVAPNRFRYAVQDEEPQTKTAEELIKDVVDLDCMALDKRLIFPVYIDEQERKNVKNWYRQYLYKQGIKELYRLIEEKELNGKKEKQKAS